MRKTIIFSLFLLILSVSGCSASSKGLSGTVVDAETGKPIEGAVVLVEWTRKTGIGDKHTVSVKVVEKVTDKEGKFSVAGTFKPFVDPPDVTVYKKGYVAWNNKMIFPEYKSREDFKWQNGYVFWMDRFKEGYFYNKHLSFIRTCSNDTLSSEKKKIFENAYEWEVDLARDEVLREK